MKADRLTIALITDVFPDASHYDRLGQRLLEARERGAALAVLPELPLNRWAPSTKQAAESDAEAPAGDRQSTLAHAARGAGIAVVGGAIVLDPETGRRHNTAVLYDSEGEEVLRYRKIHLPNEEGFWEAHHYEPGDELGAPVEVAGWSVGAQICSDVNRPEGCHFLAAMGADVIVAPRATPAETYPRWRFVLRADAVTSCTYLISVNRPEAPGSEPVGGPTLAIAPDGEVLAETDEAVAVLTLERGVLERARRGYPGYLDVRADVYERAWRRVAEG